MEICSRQKTVVVIATLQYRIYLPICTNMIEKCNKLWSCIAHFKKIDSKINWHVHSIDCVVTICKTFFAIC